MDTLRRPFSSNKMVPYGWLIYGLVHGFLLRLIEESLYCEKVGQA